MINISEEDVKLIQKSILPKNCEFSLDQLSVILAQENANIIAGPGSGKTTVLITKIALLLSQYNDQKVKPKDGICIITHTNVAVDEIKQQLNNIGISKIEYPHFIGTIHDFFNRFFTIKSYYKLYDSKEHTFTDEEEYENRFKQYWEDNKPKWYTYPAPVKKINETYLHFNNSKKLSILGECSNSYSENLANTFNDLLKTGFLRQNDTLSLSLWYISNYNSQLKRAFESRFKYAFIDETQDVNILQYYLFNKIFENTNTIIQKFGDPYQALYTIFSNEEDAWIPSEEKQISYIELSRSTRFGPSIANVLKTTCIEEYTELEGSLDKKSFEPHLLIYKNKENVINKFLEIVSNIEEINDEFRQSSKPVYAVGLTHKGVLSYYKDYKELKVSNNKQNITKAYYQILLNALVKYLRSNLNLNHTEKILRNFIATSENLITAKANIGIIINQININEGKIINQSEILLVYELILKEIGIHNYDLDILTEYLEEANTYTVNIYSQHYKLEDSDLEKINSINSKGVKLKFGSVHSVKGETHKATLLLETQRKYDGNNFYDCSLIFNFLI
ncbi:UvrD-helicase domain-containing protein, partial [Priestia megaterium]